MTERDNNTKNIGLRGGVKVADTGDYCGTMGCEYKKRG